MTTYPASRTKNALRCTNTETPSNRPSPRVPFSLRSVQSDTVSTGASTNLNSTESETVELNYDSLFGNETECKGYSIRFNDMGADSAQNSEALPYKAPKKGKRVMGFKLRGKK
mmetsp:Transcript_19072/g.50578  ORF Transcript_19072/g.50578 Transcript_19072/m.50578 type:complete len:113 (+) Transcript_19072:118-456(+)|eukprot:CAMPEP_0184720604 /NCGR_PEP_ID=MMETSP0314-20130426/14164_1 /TAXON_ID=38298 /ORGANISM="Rhodella maculata, Strain CCMP 736" /LENGTH=112 /DNA_ID=CAMNT_0027184755 /DNA_START=24 /DNA_END=362 /DNA_ORIENTATION=+